MTDENGEDVPMTGPMDEPTRDAPTQDPPTQDAPIPDAPHIRDHAARVK